MVGWAHTPFGRLDTESVESLIVRVANDALADAGVAAADVDEIVLGHFNAGFSPQDFTASLVLQASPDLRFRRATRVENACATGSAAVHQGLRAIEAKAARIVLVVGVEQMTTTAGPEIGKNLLKASYVREEADIAGGFAGIFGKIAGLYFQKYGDQSDALARIAAKNHKNGVANPYAQLRKDLGFDFCRTESDKNPFVAGPLKRTDCSLVSDGAAALVLADVQTALGMRKAVVFRAAEHVQDFLPMSRRDVLKFEGCAEAWKRALASAGIALGDLSFAETHDCFTIAELIEYEAMGLTRGGEGARAVAEGWTQKDGRLPINPSGGLKSKGHPIGATGVSMHALTAMQLCGAAGDMQVKDARLGGIFNMGGTAVANYVSILERIK
jgi:acetyl-CoA C-acetyltransferase